MAPYLLLALQVKLSGIIAPSLSVLKTILATTRVGNEALAQVS